VITDVDMPFSEAGVGARAPAHSARHSTAIHSGLWTAVCTSFPDDASSKGLSNPFLLKPFTRARCSYPLHPFSIL